MSSIDRSVLGGMLAKAWHLRLIERFPSEFRTIHCGDVTTSLAHGLNVGDGWQNIVETAVVVLNKQSRLKLREDLRILDITTHTGELLIEVSLADERVRGMLAAARIISNIVCDVCGGFGRPVTVGGQTAKCDAHRTTTNGDTTWAFSIFDQDVRAGVVDPPLLAGLRNYEDAVQQCVLAFAFFIGATHGRTAESRGVQPRLIDFVLSNERVFDARFEFDPGEQLRGFVEFCRMYIVICRKQDRLHTSEVMSAHSNRCFVVRLKIWLRKTTQSAWLAARSDFKRHPYVCSFYAAVFLFLIYILLTVAMSKLMESSS